MAEAINGLARLKREQVWMTPEQSEGHEEFLRYPDRQQGHGEYNPDPQAPHGPIFRPPEELPKSFFSLAERAEEDIYKTLGVYPSNRGELPNQTSGVAVGRTIVQGNLSFVQLLQNLYTAMQTVGDIVLELIPKIYDTERIVSILDETGKQKNIAINQVQGQQVKNDVTKGINKLEVQPIASFAIQQQMIKEELYKLASLSPHIVPLVSDLISGTIESPIAPRLVDRLKTLVPENMVRQEEGLPPKKKPPSPQEQMQHLEMKKVMAEIQKIGAEVQKMRQESATKAQETFNESLHKKREQVLDLRKQALENEQIAADVYKTELEAEAEVTKAQLDNKTELIKSAMDAIKYIRKDAQKQISNADQ